MLSFVRMARNGRQPLGEGRIVIGAHRKLAIHTHKHTRARRAYRHIDVAAGNKLNAFARIGLGFFFHRVFLFWPHRKNSPLDFVILPSILATWRPWLVYWYCDSGAGTNKKKFYCFKSIDCLSRLSMKIIRSYGISVEENTNKMAKIIEKFE